MNYHKITTDDMLNGDGLRTVVWLSGCTLNCPQCFNPQTWDFNSGRKFDYNTKMEIFNDLSKPHISGLTLTGGNPLEKINIEQVYYLVRDVRNKFNDTKTIWIYTGYTWEELLGMMSEEEANAKWGDTLYLKGILLRTDVVVDGRFDYKLKDVKIPHRGSSNQRLIKAQDSIINDTIILYEL